MLAENEGYMIFTKDWDRHLLAQMGLVKGKQIVKEGLCKELKEHF